MKIFRLSTIIRCFFLPFITCVSLICYGQNVTFVTQAAVDAFDSSTSIINGSLRIGPILGSQDSDISDLSSLSNIKIVKGSLVIENNDNLLNIDGLTGLNSVENYFDIENNQSLININGLSNLDSIGGRLQIGFNSALTNVDGLMNLTFVKDVFIRDNFVLTNIDGLMNLNSIEGYIQLINNSDLTNVDGLMNLNTIGNYISIESNRDLTNVNGLANLSLIGGALWIINNNDLTDCCGIQHLLEDAQTAIGGSINISNNPSECNSEQQVLDSECENILSLPKDPMYGNSEYGSIKDFIVYPNPITSESIISFVHDISSNIVFTIHNMSGQMIYKNIIHSPSGENKIQIPKKILEQNDGVCMIYMNDQKTASIERIMVLR